MIFSLLFFRLRAIQISISHDQLNNHNSNNEDDLLATNIQGRKFKVWHSTNDILYFLKNGKINLQWCMVEKKISRYSCKNQPNLIKFSFHEFLSSNHSNYWCERDYLKLKRKLEWYMIDWWSCFWNLFWRKMRKKAQNNYIITFW